MPTRRYSLNTQDAEFQIIEAVGAAVATKSIEFTVDFSALTAQGLSDAQANLQVLLSLEKLHAYIERGVWPPA